jgi:hypothetical protein
MSPERDAKQPRLSPLTGLADPPVPRMPSPNASLGIGAAAEVDG